MNCFKMTSTLFLLALASSVLAKAATTTSTTTTSSTTHVTDDERAWLARQREQREAAAAKASASESALGNMASELEAALSAIELDNTVPATTDSAALASDSWTEAQLSLALRGVEEKGHCCVCAVLCAVVRSLQNIAPIWARLAGDYAKDPRIQFGRVNGDSQDRLMARYSIKGYPNMLLFTKGNLADGGELYKGFRTYETMAKWLQDRIGAPMLTPVKKVAEYHARLAEFNERNKDILKQPTKASLGVPKQPQQQQQQRQQQQQQQQQRCHWTADDDGLLGSESDAPYEPTDEGMFGVTSSLYFQAWQLEQDASEKRVVLLLHDFGAHSGYWQPVVDYLYRRRYTLYAADLAAHGRSAGLRGSIPSLTELADDVVALARRARRDEGVKDVILVGHGLGALVALQTAAVAPRGIAGVVAVAPLLGGAAPLGGVATVWGDALGDIMAAVWPDFAVDRTVTDEQLLLRKRGLAAQLALIGAHTTKSRRARRSCSTTLRRRRLRRWRRRCVCRCSWCKAMPIQLRRRTRRTSFSTL
jgi:pimeloyl-ACP methyl ester carboxylesterase